MKSICQVSALDDAPVIKNRKVFPDFLGMLPRPRTKEEKRLQ